MDNFKEFAKNTSIHGIKYTVISTTTIFEKIFWALVLTCSLFFAGYLTHLFWSRYTSNPTRILLKTSHAPLNTVPFPGVTICNRNAIFEDKIDGFLSKLESTESQMSTTRRVFSNMFYESLITRGDVEFNASDLMVAQNVLDQNDYSDMRRIVRRVSQKCDSLILRCGWNRKIIPCSDIFEETFTSHGRCCSFNYIRKKSSNSVRKTLYYGLSTGLNVLLKPDYDNRNLAGVIAIIHNPVDFPGSHQNVKKHLSLGRANYLHIEGFKRECSSEVQNLPINHRHCLYSQEKHLKYFDFYTDSNCISLCEANSLYKQCGCVPYYYDYVDDKPTCNILHQPCLINSSFVNQEPCDCPSECEDNFYDILMTSTKFGNDFSICMMDYLQDINDTENHILMNIFFASNRQTIWLRNTMTSEIYLISSFGGIYSLFLGCSIVTLIEIFYYSIGKFLIKYIFHTEDKIINEKVTKKTPMFGFKDHNIYSVSKELKNDKLYYSNPIIPFIN